MKPETISLRRRYLLIAGASAPAALIAAQCGAAGSALAAGLPASASRTAGTLIVSGRMLDGTGKPLAGALVEVWQADARGDYSQVGAKPDDAGCLLRASLRTDADGRYSFRTVAPGEYPGRPRHMHYRVSAKGYATLVTQLYFGRERGVPPELTVTAAPKDGALAATFDVTLAKA